MVRVEQGPGSAGRVRALLLSLAAAAVPVSGAFLYPEHLRDYEALTWLLLLVPAFLLAYERGWRGVATALASGMAALSVTYAVSQSLGGALPPLLLPVIVAYVAVSLGIGWFREKVSTALYDVAAETFALQDRLTGLANRRRVELHLDLQFATAERGLPLSVVMFGVDRLHAYNLRNGRAAGDGVLRSFATLLRQQTRRMDLAARYGADEFMVVLGGVTEEGAVIFAARVLEQLRAAEQMVALPTVSAGVATYGPGIATPQDLVGAAEAALRAAKEDGRDRVRIHGRAMDELGDAVGAALSAAPRPDGGHADTGPAEGRAALVLTRDAIARARLAQILRRQGFDVLQAVDPQQVAASLHREWDIVFVELAADAVAELLGEIRLRSPATRVVGITPPATEQLTPDMLRIRVDGHYAVADEEAAVLRQVAELLHERDELAETQLRHHQLSHELRSRDRELRAALSASETRYAALVNAMSDVVLEANGEGRVVALNPAWTALTGRPVYEVLGQPLAELVHDDDREALAAGLAGVLAGDRAFWKGAVRLGAPDRPVAADLRLEAVRAADGTIAGVAGLAAATTSQDTGFHAMTI